MQIPTLNPTLTELINTIAALERVIDERDDRIEILERKLAALEESHVEEQEKVGSS